MLRSLAIVLVATFCVPSLLSAQKTDVVTLKRGDAITGEVKELTRGKLTYKTDDMGTIEIEWPKIAHVVSRHFFEIDTRWGRQYYGKLDRTETSGELLVILQDTASLRMENVVYIVPIRGSFWSRLDGYVDLGFDFVKANNLRTLNGAGQVRYRGTRWDGQLKGSSYLQGQDSVSTTSRQSLEFQAARLLSGRFNVTAAMAAESNSQLALDLRTTIGAGATFDAFTTNLHSLYFRALLSYARETYATEATDGSEGRNTGQVDFGANYDLFRFVFPKTDIKSTLDVIPILSESGRVRIDFDTRISYEVFKDFTLSLRFWDNFDSRNPSSGVKENDYGLSFGLGYKF